MIIGSLLLILVAVVLLVLGLTDGSSLMLTGSIAASLLAAVALVVGARQETGSREADPDEQVRPGTPGGGAEAGEPAQPYAMAGAHAGRAGGHGGLYGASAQAESPTVTLPGQPPGGGGFGAPPQAGVNMPGRDVDWDEADITDSIPAGAVPAGSHPRDGASNLNSTDLNSTDLGSADLGSAELRAADFGASDPGGDGFDDEDPPDEPAPQVVPAAEAARIARLTTDVLVIDGRPRYHLPGCVHLLGRDSEPLPVGEAVELGFTPCSLCEPDSALLSDPRAR